MPSDESRAVCSKVTVIAVIYARAVLIESLVMRRCVALDWRRDCVWSPRTDATTLEGGPTCGCCFCFHTLLGLSKAIASVVSCFNLPKANALWNLPCTFESSTGASSRARIDQLFPRHTLLHCEVEPICLVRTLHDLSADVLVQCVSHYLRVTLKSIDGAGCITTSRLLLEKEATPAICLPESEATTPVERRR